MRILPFSLLLLTGCSLFPRGSLSARHSTVTAITDGDTVKIRVAGEIEPVRLVGIECPEVRRTAKARRQADRLGLTLDELLARGRAATERLRRMVQGRSVKLVWPYEPGRRDRFERLLAYIEIDGIDAGELLPKESFAWPLMDYEHQRQDRYEAA